ncbi:ATP synthase F1 subunit gamma [Dictyobacter aurantiacus]|uniref:ATP synthase gamma chain n=1 Tax=Dictyobacter aurantiacus TaxID=1936993 RepID=A0A401ZBC9_9CHLR|nr:ATP synthase F1 subunit gamma [Dictyobacter aurantiacus]GCE04190.1 ATP synthase gamma chain [Dictyobacter aurantiacus]
MPSTREIRQRIRSVKNTAKITKAMQMVASSKMRRAQERVEQARPFADQIRELVSRLATAAANGNEDLAEDLALLKQRPVRNIGIVLISPDRGLCGALPSNINRQAALTARNESQRLSAQGRSPDVEYIAVGRKGRDFVVRNDLGLAAEFTNYGDRPGIADASAIAQVAVDAFLKGEVDVVYLVYAKFVNTVTQTPVTVQLLPVQPPEKQEEEEQAKDTTEYIYEPDEQTIFKALLPRYVDIQVYQALLEAVASQQSAQMVAMKNATDNANELIQDLTLTYNKVRQAAITTQILEVVAGAEAL